MLSSFLNLFTKIILAVYGKVYLIAVQQGNLDKLVFLITLTFIITFILFYIIIWSCMTDSNYNSGYREEDRLLPRGTTERHHVSVYLDPDLGPTQSLHSYYRNCIQSPSPIREMLPDNFEPSDNNTDRKRNVRFENDEDKLN